MATPQFRRICEDGILAEEEGTIATFTLIKRRPAPLEEERARDLT